MRVRERGSGEERERDAGTYMYTSANVTKYKSCYGDMWYTVKPHPLVHTFLLCLREPVVHYIHNPT